MIGILTGDIVNSRTGNPKVWLPLLENAIAVFSDKFDIYRGDSFQARVKTSDVFTAVFYIKAAMLAIGLDVRIGVGVGEEEVEAEHVKNMFGSALTYSGEAFDQLKRDTIAVRTSNADFDNMSNTMLTLAAELCVRWTSNIAETVKVALLNEGVSQKELAELLNKNHQSQVSSELQKAGFAKIKKAIDYCTQKLLEL